MNNKTSRIRIALFVLAPIAFFGIYVGLKKSDKKPESSKQVLSADFINFYSISDSSLIHFPESLHTLLVYFNSDCHYCWKEFKEFEKNKERFSGVEVFFFSAEPIEQIRTFVNKYDLSSQKNFHFVKISPEHEAEVFGYIVPPSFFIYRDNRLVREISGNIGIEEILKNIQ